MRKTLAAAFGLLAASAACTSTFGSQDATTHERPHAVTDTTTCAEWMDLPLDVRLDYAMYRLAAMREQDGLDPDVQPPSESQASLLRTHMEAQCGQDSMDVAAVFRVAHDQYTLLYDRQVLLD